MNKILVEIICSATSKSYDFWVNSKMPVGFAIKKMVTDICMFEENSTLFNREKKVDLFSYEQSIFINENHTFTESGIKAGDRLLII